MDEKELIGFVEKISLCNNASKIRLELGQLISILQADGASSELIDKVLLWKDAAPEIGRLCGKVSSGTRLTVDDMNDAVKHAAIRHREEESRNGKQ